MINSLLEMFKFGILFLPLMILFSQPLRIRNDYGSISLLASYLFFVVNEIVFSFWGRPFYYFHVLIDSGLLSLVIGIITTQAIASPQKKNHQLWYILLSCVLILSTIVFIVRKGNPEVFASVNILIVFAINSIILIRHLGDDATPYLKILLLWLLSHFIYYAWNEYAINIVTILFFGAVSYKVARLFLASNYKILQEKDLLVRARDVVVSMLTDISTSSKNISSLEYTLIRILETIIDSLSVEGAAVYTLETVNGKQVVKYSQSTGIFWTMDLQMHHVPDNTTTFDREDLKKKSFDLGEGLVGVVAQTQEPLEIDRTRNKEEMSKLGLHPAKIRNIFAVPLKVKEQVLGVVIVQNRKDGSSFKSDEKDLLRALADQAAISINNVRMYAELAVTDRLRQEMQIATNIQVQLLPESVPVSDTLQIAAYIQPAKEVGGDYYDFLEAPDGKINIAVGDVSGKGLPAGMIMIIARTTLHIVARGKSDVKEILTRFAQEMFPRMHHGQFMTFVYLSWDESNRKLSYAGAGHEHILWYHKKTGVTEKIRTGGIAVGLVENPDTYISHNELQTERGDVIVLYTDGVTDARNVQQEMYTLKRLQLSLETHAPLSDAQQINDTILKDVYEFMGGSDQYDDITLLVLYVK